MKSFLDYLAGVRAEMTHVKWPSNAQAVGYTALVIIISLLVAAFLGGLDFVFTIGTEELIRIF
jgi:preprotein translocase SecE subunit